MKLIIKKSVIHIAIAFDENYLNQFFALYKSLVCSNRENELHLHCIATGVPDEELKRIKTEGNNDGVQLLFYDIDEELAGRFITTGYWTKAVYYRLFFPLIVAESIERLLYIDTDALVLSDLKTLYSEDLNHRPVGAVYDNYVKKQPLIGIHEEGQYFNSGVLLIDIAKWKEQKISEQSFIYLDAYPERIKYVDQCALNAVLKNNWKPLPVKYNCMYSYIPEGISDREGKEFLQNKIILHFTLQRPWLFLCKSPYKHLYFYYLKKFPGKKAKVINDFSVNKIPSFIKITLIRYYHNTYFLKKAWRKINKG